MSRQTQDDAIQPKSLERALSRAKELERLGSQIVEDEKDLGDRAEAYKRYGIRSFPVADALARYDVPLLVDEIKRLRGWDRGR